MKLSGRRQNKASEAVRREQGASRSSRFLWLPYLAIPLAVALVAALVLSSVARQALQRDAERAALEQAGQHAQEASAVLANWLRRDYSRLERLAREEGLGEVLAGLPEGAGFCLSKPISIVFQTLSAYYW
ncbi:hypothetical protein CAI21_07500 [Alkalilimnicola ehrlichii]|uniref:Uncharacterized protein n=1 Tax=Alkalilimnicola ehrlichii TaxID=351052 RepID=A0A3E0WYX8_9GAMM|nr:hypothetical protein [Alkalilimnicola ehrlichii]RFA30049.1 hypothetical protein CAI21_07500 [Alkalilimnicola ehrlichii]RFA37391.1 hypothetical protein CAL65_08830 [Alkalilimnicola ehrlichii]